MKRIGYLWRSLPRADRVVLVLAWGGALASLAWYFQAPAGQRAEVIVSDQVVAELDLGRERTLTVEGPMGDSHLQVRDGAIRFVPPSPAPRKIDLRAGWQRHAGDSAACVPNKVLVRVRGGTEQRGGFDALNF